MKTAVLLITVVLLASMQVVYPAQLAPWHLVPDIAMLVTFSLALYYVPAEHVLWYGLAAGLAIDLWQPSHFGIWSLACMLVVLLTRIVHTRLLPSSHWLSVLATAAIALGVGELAIAVREQLLAGLGTFSLSLLRIYLPRLALDLVLVIPVTALIRSILRTLRVTGDTHIVLPHGTRR